MNIAEALNRASLILAENQIPDPRRESASLLVFVLECDRAFLVAHAEYQLSMQEHSSYFTSIARRAAREPFQYIIGTQEFYGLNFAVSPLVLIPRPETEVLVSAAIERIKRRKFQKFIEIGVGSGCITISILKNIPNATAVATDISEKAIQIAVRNATSHAVQARVEFRIGDLYSPVESLRFDAILSNPPYIPCLDIPGLQPEVRLHEPLLALTDFGNGLNLIEKIVTAAPQHLNPEGFLALEIGFGQVQPTIQMFTPLIWKSVEIIQDMRGIERIVIADLA